MYEHFDNIIKGITEKLKQDPEGINARKKYALELSKLGKKLSMLVQMQYTLVSKV